MDNLHSFNVMNGNCNQFSPEQFNHEFSSSNRKLFIINLNIQSYYAHIDEFTAFIDELYRFPDVIILTETWKSNDRTAEIEGYKSFHCNRSTRRGGGVSVFINQGLKANSAKISMESLPEIEYLRVKVTFNNFYNAPLDIIAIYHPPNSSLNNQFLDYIDSILEALGSNSNQIIAGDFNICGLRNTPISNKLFDIMRSYSFMPHISKITRYNTHGLSTAIDHIWSNFGFDFESGVFSDTHVSDHFVTFAFLPLMIDKTKTVIRFRNHSEECIQKLIDGLTNFNLFYPLLSADLNYDAKFNLFYDELLRLYNKFCPINVKEISLKNSKKPWITREIILKIRNKHSLFRSFKNGNIPYHQFQTHQKELDKSIKMSKKSYYNNKFQEYGNNSKNTWKLTNDLLGTSKKSTGNISIIHENNTVENEVEVANHFNNYFVNIGHNLINSNLSHNANPMTYLEDRLPNSFFFHETNFSEISKIINNFKNKKTTINNIPNFIIKKISHVVTPILVELFNESIINGVFPHKLKIGRVIPLHKAGSTTSLKNYRPITTLSVFSKIFEKLVHKRMTSFISRYNIIKLNQFGFQRNKNTSDAILEFLENIYESFDENNLYLSVFLDFSKAFDTISHDILLTKLEFMGFRGPLLSWITSYLSNRSQYVEVGGSSSYPLPITIGVPQGSTLGPLLFLLYINDMENCLNDMNIIHFADDSTLHVKFNRDSNVTAIADNELSSINTWLLANKLCLNIDKTKYMIFYLKNKPPDLNISIANTFIGRTDVHKFLGVYIDENLNFGTHTTKLCAKISRGIGILRRLKPLVSQGTLKQLYYAFVYAHFSYAITSYQSAYLNQIQKLKNLINKAIKLVFNLNTIVPALLSEKCIMNFEMAAEYFSCINIYRIMKLNSHQFFKDKIASFQIEHNYLTRASTLEIVDLPFYRLSKSQRSFLYKGLTFWNRIPIDIRNIPDNPRLFKRRLRKHIFDRI